MVYFDLAPPPSRYMAVDRPIPLILCSLLPSTPPHLLWGRVCNPSCSSQLGGLICLLWFQIGLEPRFEQNESHLAHHQPSVCGILFSNMWFRTKLSKTSQGVHVQASSLGSLEALMEFLNENGVPIGSFGIGMWRQPPPTLVHVRPGFFHPLALSPLVSSTCSLRREHPLVFHPQDQPPFPVFFSGSTVLRSCLTPCLGTLQNVHNRGAGFGATCLCFDVAITRQARKSAVNYNVDIIEGNVIYQLFEEFKRKKRTFLAKVKKQQNNEPDPSPPSFLLSFFFNHVNLPLLPTLVLQAFQEYQTHLWSLLPFGPLPLRFVILNWYFRQMQTKNPILVFLQLNLLWLLKLIIQLQLEFMYNVEVLKLEQDSIQSIKPYVLQPTATTTTSTPTTATTTTDTDHRHTNPERLAVTPIPRCLDVIYVLDLSFMNEPCMIELTCMASFTWCDRSQPSTTKGTRSQTSRCQKRCCIHSHPWSSSRLGRGVNSRCPTYKPDSTSTVLLNTIRTFSSCNTLSAINMFVC